MPSTYTPIATYTAPSAQTSYTFSSIPSTYTDLVLVLSTATDAGGDPVVQFNSDTGSNYSNTYLSGTGSAANSNRTTSQSYARTGYYGGGPSVVGKSTTVVSFQNYSNATTYKTFLSRANNADAGTDAIVGLWRSTSAISSIKFFYTGANIVTGSTLTLYGIAAA